MGEPNFDPGLFAAADAAPGAQDAKAPWQSRGVVFGVMSAAGALGALVGIDIDASQATDIVLLVLTAVSGLLSAWGRWRATRPVRLRPAGG